MPAISITDLENAKLDVDHIAEMATSLAATATDRLGHVKQTMSAAGNDVALTAAGQATTARIAAEAARDAALIQAGVYTTEALGRAAVADGVAFKVQGSGDVAAYEYRRTNSTTSVLIATYPAASAVLSPKWAGKENVWPDPFFTEISTATISFRGRLRWFYTTGTAMVDGWTIVPSTVFDGNALRRTSGYNSTSQSGPRIWLDEANVVSGETLTAYTLFTGAAQDVYCAVQWRDASGAAIGAAISMTTEAGANKVVASTTPQWLRFSGVAPAGATSLVIYAYNLSGATSFDMHACWAFKGSVTEGPSWPSSLVKARRLDLELFRSSGVTAPAANKIAGAYVPYATLEHVLGSGESVGDSTYSQKVLGFYEQVTAKTLLNAVAVPVWAANATTAVEWKAWIRTVTTAFNMSSTPATLTGTITAGNFPTTNGSYTLSLPSVLTLEANEYLFVSFRAVDDTNISIARWLYNAGIVPQRHPFIFSTTAGWNAVWSATTVTSGYGQPAMKFLMESDELRAYKLQVTAAIAASVSVPPTPELVMPPYIFGVQGRECNVYFDNLHLAAAGDYLHDVTSASTTGTQQQERWTWTPSGALTSGSVVVGVNDKRTGTALVTKTSNQRAAASTAGTGLTKKVIVVGDSLVAAGVITQTMLDISAGDAMHATMLGTLGTAPNQHEGRGGWTVSTYVTTGSPFYISGAVNFPQYLTNNSIAVPDWVLIHLGINDVFGQTTDAGASSTADSAFTLLDTLITSIKVSGAGVNVGLMIPTPPSATEDAFGANYATGSTRWRFKRNILIWARQMLVKYAGQEASRIYLIPSNTALDTVNNMSIAASAPVNSRSLVSSTRQSNGVHPATQGYQQIGDAVWAFLKYYA